MNIIQERNQRLEQLFVKIEEALTDNFEVISKLLVPAKKSESES